MEIVAIDWGSAPHKRQQCRAVLRGNTYVVHPPAPVGDPAALALPPGGLAAFDCPLGLPAHYAARARLASFRDALTRFGRGRFGRFWEPAAVPADIALGRPFYPASPRGARRRHAPGLFGPRGLRACDVAANAAPIFWLVGPRQVGRSAITVWRNVLLPRLPAIALWPFDGKLPALLASGRPVVAEMYPALLLRTLGLRVRGKRDGQARAAAGRALLARLDGAPGLDLRGVRALLRDGFGPGGDGEDPFDATVACIALARLLCAGAVPEPPPDVAPIEGWILGLPPAAPEPAERAGRWRPAATGPGRLPSAGGRCPSSPPSPR